MGMERSPFFIGLILVLFLGVAVYLRLWAIDFSFSKDDNDLLRRQFDLASREAMEESAEWRLKYDEEVERGTQRLRELIQVKEALEQKIDETASIDNRLIVLQKENDSLLKQVESLTRELETVKSRCNTRNQN
ncbi:uncharacterized protein LOC131240339 [Magnolia sinica]|uniref:uncharacterized protein LOC131240339 n=1 Tax=Magnolia sinica TaxID=86752 RepID=UPI002658082F|nr:uncharacterized protein LOC131240339 [Magnolia sinica]